MFIYYIVIDIIEYLGTSGFLSLISLSLGPSICTLKYLIPAIVFSTAAFK